MICEYCSQPLGVDDVAVMEQYGVVVDGVFQPTEPPTLHHAEGCGDDEDDDVSPVEYFHGKEV